MRTLTDQEWLVIDQFSEIWHGWVRDAPILSEDNVVTVMRWVIEGADFAMLDDALNVTLARCVPTEDTWRYLCGVMWRRLRPWADRGGRVRVTVEFTR